MVQDTQSQPKEVPCSPGPYKAIRVSHVDQIWVMSAENKRVASLPSLADKDTTRIENDSRLLAGSWLLYQAAKTFLRIYKESKDLESNDGLKAAAEIASHAIESIEAPIKEQGIQL